MHIIDSLAEVAGRYDAVFCDLWGCLHNGIAPFPDAVAALQGFRQNGGRVVLLTNAPRPRADVAKQLDGMGVPRDCWDTIATSGDSARFAMFQGVVGSRVYHIGEARDSTFFEPIHLHAEAEVIPVWAESFDREWELETNEPDQSDMDGSEPSDD